jgi:hypothetical protein
MTADIPTLYLRAMHTVRTVTIRQCERRYLRHAAAAELHLAEMQGASDVEAARQRYLEAARDEAETDLQSAALERLIDYCDQIVPDLHLVFAEQEQILYPDALADYAVDLVRLVPEMASDG